MRIPQANALEQLCHLQQSLFSNQFMLCRSSTVILKEQQARALSAIDDINSGGKLNLETAALLLRSPRDVCAQNPALPSLLSQKEVPVCAYGPCPCLTFASAPSALIAFFSYSL